jgi:hypothetical protein
MMRRRYSGNPNEYRRRYMIACLCVAALMLIAGFVFLGLSLSQSNDPYENYQYIYIILFAYAGLEIIFAFTCFCMMKTSPNSQNVIVVNQSIPMRGQMQAGNNSPYAQNYAQPLIS